MFNKLIYILILLFPIGLKANSDTIVLRHNHHELWLKNNWIEIFEDTSAKLDFLAIQNKAVFSHSEGDNYIQNPKSKYWIKFTLKDSSLSDLPFRIEIYDFDIDQIEFHQKNQEGKFQMQKAGYSLNFKERSIDHKNVSFLVQFYDRKDNTIYMSFQSKRKSLMVPVIKKYDSVFGYALNEYILFGIFYGLFIFVIVYNLVYFLILRKREDLLYIFYAFGVLLFLMSENGTGFQFLWPSFPEYNKFMGFLGLFAGIESLLFFAIHFLRLKTKSEHLYRLFIILILIRALVFLIELFWINNFFSTIVDVILIQVILYACWVRYKNGFKNVNWVLYSFLVLDLSLLLTIAEHQDWIASNFFTVYSLNIGVIIQFILMSIGVAESVSKTYKEKNLAQAELLQLTTNNNLQLEKQVVERTIELQHKNDQITSSVRYAEQIQNAILPSLDLLQVKSQYLLYKPRDIVSGDFYWFHKIDANRFLVVLADCTGHGVPGAFMSMIGINLLNTIVREKAIQPDKILAQLHIEIQKVLRQQETNNQDGMDVSVCFIDTETKEIQFSGAKSSLILVVGNELIRLRGSKSSIGGNEGLRNAEFSLNTLSFAGQSLKVFLYSDGLIDQFGGNQSKKFGTKSLIRAY